MSCEEPGSVDPCHSQSIALYVHESIRERRLDFVALIFFDTLLIIYSLEITVTSSGRIFRVVWRLSIQTDGL
jgi:hypothetical protein